MRMELMGRLNDATKQQYVLPVPWQMNPSFVRLSLVQKVIVLIEIPPASEIVDCNMS